MVTAGSREDKAIKFGKWLAAVLRKQWEPCWRLLSPIVSPKLEKLAEWDLAPHLLLLIAAVWLAGRCGLNGIITLCLAGVWLHQIQLAQEARKAFFSRSRERDEQRFKIPPTNELVNVAWLNRIMDDVWPIFLSPWLSEMVKGSLQGVLDRIRPAKIFESLLIEEFSFGSSPLRIDAAHVFGVPESDDHAVVEVEVRFAAGEDFKITLAASTWAAPVHVYASKLALQGKLRLYLKWCSAGPFLDRLKVAFTEPPLLDFEVKPLTEASFSVTDLPVVSSWIQRTVTGAIRRFLVEPNPLVVELGQMLQNPTLLDPSEVSLLMHTTVEVIRAEGLMVADSAGSSDPYVKIEVGPECGVYRTPTIWKSRSPRWDYKCKRTAVRLRLHHNIVAEFFSCEVTFTIYDKDIKSVDDYMGSAKLRVHRYADGRRHEVVLPVKGGTGTLYVAVTTDLMPGVAALLRSMNNNTMDAPAPAVIKHLEREAADRSPEASGRTSTESPAPAPSFTSLRLDLTCPGFVINLLDRQPREDVPLLQIRLKGKELRLYSDKGKKKSRLETIEVTNMSSVLIGRTVDMREEELGPAIGAWIVKIALPTMERVIFMGVDTQQQAENIKTSLLRSGAQEADSVDRSITSVFLKSRLGTKMAKQWVGKHNSSKEKSESAAQQGWKNARSIRHSITLNNALVESPEPEASEPASPPFADVEGAGCFPRLLASPFKKKKGKKDDLTARRALARQMEAEQTPEMSVKSEFVTKPSRRLAATTDDTGPSRPSPMLRKSLTLSNPRGLSNPLGMERVLDPL